MLNTKMRVHKTQINPLCLLTKIFESKYKNNGINIKYLSFNIKLLKNLVATINPCEIKYKLHFIYIINLHKIKEKNNKRIKNNKD